MTNIIKVTIHTPHLSVVSFLSHFCKFDNGYQDFYYSDTNNAFKQLTYSDDIGVENEDDYRITFRESWREESVGIKCPKEYADMCSCM